MAASTSYIASAFAGLFDGPLAGVAQEVMVVCVFAISVVAWRHIGLGRRPSPAAGLKASKAAKQVPVIESDAIASKVSDGTPKAQQRPTRINSAVVSGQTKQHISVRAAEQQMLKHLQQREFTRALNQYRSLERDGRERYFSEELFSAFIQSAIRVGKLDVVERMLRSMQGADLKPSLGFWQTTLRMLSSRKHFSTCVTVHSLFGKDLPAEKVVYSCLVNAALEVNIPEHAAIMLTRYSQADLCPKDYVLFFRVYVAMNDVESAEVVFRKLGKECSTLMLNLLLLTCANTKQPERGLDFLREAHEMERGCQQKIADVVSYNTVIKGFSHTGDHKRCFECLRDMHANQLEPDDITFGTLLDACIVDNDIGSAHEIINLLIEGDRPLDAVMCTLFIKGLVRANCLPKALELYEEMRRREGAHPDIVTYSVLIKALVDQHEVEKALGLVEDMKKSGLAPDDIILTHLLEGCRHAGNHELGKKLFKELLANGVKPSEYTLVTMLKLHGRCGAHKEAQDLVKTWEAEHGFKPSIIHYTCLMSGCLRTKSYDQAWAAYELMSANGIALDKMAVSTLLPGMVAAQHWDRVVLLVERALRATPPISLPPETLSSALSQMMAARGSGHGKHVDQLRTLMSVAGVPVSARPARRM